MSREHRIEMQKLADIAKDLHATERRITLDSVYRVEELEQNCVWLYLRMKPADLAVYIGLTPNMYWSRLRAARVIRQFPSLLKLYESGETRISHIAMLSRKITVANENVILEGIKGKTKREDESLLSRVADDGELSADEGVTEITVRFTDSERKIFDRARENLAHGGHVPTQAETILKASAMIIERCDPMKKAERAAARADRKAAACTDHKLKDAVKIDLDRKNEIIEDAQCFESFAAIPQDIISIKRKPIPAAVRHKVWLRDQGKCTYVNADGTKCDQHMMLEVDHIDMVCLGGSNDEKNLRLRCRFHNAWQAA